MLGLDLKVQIMQFDNVRRWPENAHVGFLSFKLGGLLRRFL